MDLGMLLQMLAGAQGGGASADHGNVIVITDTAKFVEKISEPKLTVVDWFATWCMPCKIIAPTFAELSKKYLNVNFLKVDVDQNSDLAMARNVSAMPTFHFYMNGEKVDEFSGASPSQLEETLKAHGGAIDPDWQSKQPKQTSQPAASGPAAGPVVISSQEQFQDIINSNPGKLIAVDFYADWCGPCRAISPKFAELAKTYPNAIFLCDDMRAVDSGFAKRLYSQCFPCFGFGSTNADNHTQVKINADEWGDITDKCQVRALPTFCFFKNGGKVDQMTGASIGRIEDIVKKYY